MTIANISAQGGLPSPQPDTSSHIGTQNGTSLFLDPLGFLAEFQKLAASLLAQNPNGTPGVNNPQGAPEIDEARYSFSPEDMILQLQYLQGKTKQAQLDSARENLVGDQSKIDQNQKDALAKIDTWTQKCTEAAEQQKASAILGWVTAGVGLLAAAIGVVVSLAAIVVACCTAGAAAPIAAACIAGVVAACGLVGGGFALASSISQACGGAPAELSSLASDLCTRILIDLGVPEEKAKSGGKLMSGALGLFCTAGLGVLVDQQFAGNALAGLLEVCDVPKDVAQIIGMVATLGTTIAIAAATILITLGAGTGAAVSSIAKAAGSGVKAGSDALKLVTQTAQAVKIISNFANGLCSLTKGGLSIAQGALGVSEAVTRREGDQARIDKKHIDAIIVGLMKAMEDEREQLKKVMQEIEEGLQVTSEILSGAHDNREQLVINMGACNAV